MLSPKGREVFVKQMDFWVWARYRHTIFLCWQRRCCVLLLPVYLLPFCNAKTISTLPLRKCSFGLRFAQLVFRKEYFSSWKKRSKCSRCIPGLLFINFRFTTWNVSFSYFSNRSAPHMLVLLAFIGCSFIPASRRSRRACPTIGFSGPLICFTTL